MATRWLAVESDRESAVFHAADVFDVRALSSTPPDARPKGHAAAERAVRPRHGERRDRSMVVLNEEQGDTAVRLGTPWEASVVRVREDDFVTRGDVRRYYACSEIQAPCFSGICAFPVRCV
jgi:hypothetical protein